MQVVSPKGQRLRVEHPDRVELARAVEAEGEPRELVAQALVNRWVHLRDHGGTQPLGELVRAYSQPISPRWFPLGDRHLAALRSASTEAERDELQRRASKRQSEHATRTMFSPSTLEATRRALGGPLTLDPRIVHFAVDTPERRARLPLVYLHPNGVGFYGAEEGEAERYSLPKAGPTWAAAAVLDSGRAAPALGLLAAVYVIVAIAARRGRA